MATFAEVLPMLTHKGAQIYRESESQDHYELDGADGLTIWKYDGEEDDLIHNWKFDVHQIVATDWAFKGEFQEGGIPTRCPHTIDLFEGVPA